MIAPLDMPRAYLKWNRRWGAPFGSRLYRSVQRWPRLRGPFDRTMFRVAPGLRGMFAIQPNNATRAYEYPWVFDACRVARGMRVLEIGGGLSGFQFVLDRSGADVTNVDPGEAAHGRGWPVDEHSIARLNRVFGTSIELRNTFLQDAGLESASFDRVISVSTIEHIPESELPSLMSEVVRLLKPGGMFVATVDLFLNVQPFTTRERNEFGTNISVADLIEPHGLELVAGAREELHGYKEFSPGAVQSRLENYLLGSYPALIQTLVAKKPEHAA